MNLVKRSIEFVFRKKWLGLIVVIALFCGIGISTVYRGAFGPKQRTDLAVFVKAAEMVSEGRAYHIYGIETSRHWHYVYSPFLAILLSPFTQSPFVVFVVLSYLLSVFCLLWTVGASGRFVPAPEAEGIRWKSILAAFLCLPVLINTLTRGQLGILILGAQTAVFLCYLRGWKVLAGFLLALATAIKISPLAALVFFFLFKKEWRVLLSAFLCCFLFLVLFPSLVIGFQQNWEHLKTWQGLMSEGSSILAYKHYLWSELFTPFADDNQSLYAVITRLAWQDQNDFITHPSNWVRILTTLSGGLALAGLFLKRKPSGTFPVPEKERPGLLAEYSLYPVMMLIFSPMAQVHHYTAVYFLYLAGFLMADAERGRKLILTAIWGSATFFLLGLIVDPLAYWGLPMWGALLLWLVVFFRLK